MIEYRLVITYGGNGEFCYEIRELSVRESVIEFMPSSSFWVDWDADSVEGINQLRKEFEDAVAKPPVFQEYDKAIGMWTLREGKSE
jgi:hypothetical protein